jgi:IS30 family transposase
VGSLAARRITQVHWACLQPRIFVCLWGLSRTGGIRPPTRSRSCLALSLSEREEISRGIASDLSLRAIALQLGRAPSTISREMKRHGGRDHYCASNALIKQSRKLPNELYKSLTWDRGKELADHQRFSLATHVDVYFCDPHSPWQRGSNENTNGLLRRYFLKGMDPSNIHQNRLNAVARRLNERPR